MKTSINKSRIMREAWKAYKSSTDFIRLYGEFYNLDDFGECLKMAWAGEKSRVAEAIKEATHIEEQARLIQWWSSEEYKTAKTQKPTPTPDIMESYYRSGVYSGD